MFERLVGRRVGERVEANGQGLGFLVRNEIDLGAVDGAQQTASIIMAAHRLAYDLCHGRLGSIGDHLMVSTRCLLCVLRRSKRASAGRSLYAMCRCAALRWALSSSTSFFSRVMTSCRS